MKTGLLLAGIALLASAACGGGGKDLAVPNVVGERLDLAQSHLEEKGLEYEALGGGSSGIDEKWNWTVCQTEPAAGVIVADKVKVKLVADRVCPGGPGGSTSTSATPTVAPPTTMSPDDHRIAVPDVVGKSLQSAQDTMQAVGLRWLRSRDTTGQNRQRIWDRHWVVTQQTPVGGTMVDADHWIDLGAEKFTD